MLTFITRLLIIYLGILVAMTLFQRRLMYFPSKAILPVDSYGIEGAQELELVAADGVKLQAWYVPPKDGMPLMVYFHGNALNLADFVIFTALIGGALSLILLLGRLPLSYYFMKFRPNRELPRLLTKGEPVPYGIAIAGAFLILLWQQAVPGLAIKTL